MDLSRRVHPCFLPLIYLMFTFPAALPEILISTFVIYKGLISVPNALLYAKRKLAMGNFCQKGLLSLKCSSFWKADLLCYVYR